MIIVREEKAMKCFFNNFMAKFHKYYVKIVNITGFEATRGTRKFFGVPRV